MLIVSTGMCSLEKKIDFAEGLSAAVLLVAGQGASSLSNLEGVFHSDKQYINYLCQLNTCLVNDQFSRFLQSTRAS